MPKNPQTPAALALTVIKAANGKDVRKVVELAPSGRIHTVKGYPGVYKWTRAALTVPFDIDALGAVIADLATRPDVCLVTGEPVGPVPLDQPTQRLKNARDDCPASLGECAAPWLPIDADKIPLDAPLDPFDPEAAIAQVVAHLGAPFTDCSYVWQLTASATPGADILSVRLFFLTDAALTNETRKAWGEGLNGSTGVNLIDGKLYNAAQPIYTAAPEFRGVDPFPRRSGVVYGENEVVPWAQVHIAEKPKRGTYTGASFSGDTHPTIAEALGAMGDGPGQEGFHGPMTMAVWHMVSHKWTPARIKEVIREAVFSADSSRHEMAYLKGETSDAALNASIKGAARRIQATRNAPRVTQTRVVDVPVPLAEAEAKIRDVVGAWVKGEGPARVVLDVTVGSGKTTQAVQTILDELRPGANILWAAPNHNQAQDVLDRFNAGNVPWFKTAIKIESRAREGEDIQPLCARPHVIRAIKEAGLVRETARLACKSGKQECPHWHGCAYYRQFLGKERVRIVMHSHLAKHQARVFNDDFMDDCAGLIVDESPLAALVGRQHYALGTVRAAGGVLAEVIAAFADGTEIDAEATIPRLEDEMRARCVSEIPQEGGPDASEEWALLAALARFAEKKTLKMLPIYKAAIARLNGELNVLWFGKTAEGDSVFCAWRSELPAVERVLVLDGTADAEVYRALLGADVHIERVHVEQNLEIIQASDTPVGKRKLTDPQNDGVLAQAVALARSTGAGLITNKDALKLATDRKYLPADYPQAHFNALRGVNHLESLDALVIAGRPEPDALAIEAVARALWSREALNLSGGYVWRTDGLASVASHPDARCDGLLRAYREAEIAQAIGRLRAVRSVTTKRIYLLTHTPTGLPVTSRPFAEIVPPVELSRLLIAGGGVAPLAPSVMSKMLPEIWATPANAKRWCEWNLKVRFALDKDIYKHNRTFKFRVTGQRRGSMALSWLDDFDTWESLEKITGRQVVECQRVDSPPATTNVNGDDSCIPDALEAEPCANLQKVDDGCANLHTHPPLIRRSTLYARLMGGKPRDVPRFKRPRNADPPDWRELIPDPAPAFFPQPDFAGVMT